MSINYTPRVELRAGDKVKLIGKDWDEVPGVSRSKEYRMFGSTFGAHIRDSMGECWYVMDPVRYRNGTVIDYSVLRVEQ